MKELMLTLLMLSSAVFAQQVKIKVNSLKIEEDSIRFELNIGNYSKGLGFILYLFILTACNNKFAESSIVGEYVLNQSGYTDIVKINSNKTYEHIVNIEGKKIANKGKWTYNSKEILFENFSFYNSKGSSGRGLWISEIKELEDTLTLVYAEEERIYYKKRQ